MTAEYDVEAVLKRRGAITHGWDDASQVDWAEGAVPAYPTMSEVWLRLLEADRSG